MRTVFSGINDAREDGLTPIHLVASRNDDQEAKIGLMPLSEDRQVLAWSLKAPSFLCFK